MSTGEDDDDPNPRQDFGENPNEGPTWKPLTVSFVEYPKGDLWGLVLALFSHGPMTLWTSFITLILFRRDLFTMFYFTGFILNEPINQILKRTIKQPRPMRDRSQFGQYGMPSSHSQHLWFFSTFGILFVFIRIPESSLLLKLFLIGSLLGGACIVSYGRIYLKYHTWSQVLVGSVTGMVWAGIWFIFVHIIATPYFAWIVSWRVSEYFLVRDTTSIKNLIWFEYNNTIRYGMEAEEATVVMGIDS